MILSKVQYAVGAFDAKRNRLKLIQESGTGI